MYNIYDYIKCKNKIDLDKYTDISSSHIYIENKILNKSDTFRYKIEYNDPNQFLTSEDKNLFELAIKKWSDLILIRTNPEEMYDMIISVHVETNAPNVLASATTTAFRNGIPVSGSIWINDSNWRTQVAQEKEDGMNQGYYSILHELGHVFGIGTAWNHMIQDKLYFGANGVREYRKLLNNQELSGVPIEDDGGSGTRGSHIEEGAEYTISDNNRYHDGHLHLGLDRELMTGWAENDKGLEPLSRLSVGFLQDIGFVVDYKKADPYVYSNDFILNKGEKIIINGSVITIIKDMDHFIYQVPYNSGNRLNISSDGKALAYTIYYKFVGDPSYYQDYLRLNSLDDKVSEIEITSTSKSMYIHTEYQGMKTEAVLFFFRNI